MKYQVLFSHDEPHSTIDAGIIAEGSGNDGVSRQELKA